MKKLSCLIVDDEPIARDILTEYCGKLPSLNITAVSENALDALQVLQNTSIDLVFLDIEMPELSGIGFLNSLRKPPLIIFTTAYAEYAARAFDLAACDYLLKPFSFDRFIMAVDRAIMLLRVAEGETRPLLPAVYDYFFARADGKIYNVKHKDVLYAEASGNYTRIVTEKGAILPNISFLQFEELVPKTMFIRVHRSFIINRTKFSYIEGNRVFIDKQAIPIGNNYKDGLFIELGLP